MRVIKETINCPKEIVRYEAIDGTEFFIKEECEQYEKSATCAINAKYSTLVAGKTNSYDLLYGDSDSTVDIVKLSKEEDITTVLHFIAHKNCYSKDNESLVEYIPILKNAVNSGEFVFVGHNYDDDWCWVYGTTSSILEKINNVINGCVKQ